MPLMLAALQLGKDDSAQWAVLCVGTLATIYLVMRGRARKKADPLERPASLGVSQQRQLERDMSNLMVEMLETARQMTAQLDTRAARLEAIIADADARLAELKAATGAAAIAVAATPVRPTIAPPADPAVAPTAAPSEVAEPSAPPEAAADPGPAETPPDPRHAEVYALADQGRSTQEIARSLDRPNGEVELILALRRG